MKYWIIIILSLPSLLAEAQRIDTLHAAKLLDKEIEFFVSSSDSQKFSALIDKADLQRTHGEYNKALSELTRAEKFSSDENTVIRLKYEKMLNHFLSNQFNQCTSILLSPEEATHIYRQKEYFAMRLFSLNETEEWDKCKEELINFCAACDSNEIRKIVSLPVNYEYVSPEQCKQLSSFVPGLGMVKAGKPLKGASSFLLQSGLVFFIGYGFYSGYYIAGVVSGVFPLLKLHTGGARLSAILADEHNEKEKMKLKSLYSEEIKKVVHR